MLDLTNVENLYCNFIFEENVLLRVLNICIAPSLHELILIDTVKYSIVEIIHKPQVNSIYYYLEEVS